MTIAHARGRATEARALTARPDGGPRRPVRVRFKDLFVCAGAVQTPLLLRRSRLTQNIGDSLRLHPMVRVAARFPDSFNDPAWGVPVQQVDEFKPNLTLGCSHSSLPHVALWLAGQVADKRAKLRTWENMAVFYVAAVGTGTGTIRPLPFIDEPLVRLKVTDTDLALMGEGLHRLGQLLFAAGASEIYSPLDGGPTITDAAGLRDLRCGVRHGGINVTTIHLFSSCPMGEDARVCATDSFGQLRGLSNVWLNDSSILPLSPAVNPQGTVMAVARRNVTRYLDARAG
jgi:choline dehydrogenase-like flavoprotein